MHKNFIGEYLFVSAANLQILNQIFTLDFAKTIAVLLIQVIITALVRYTSHQITLYKTNNNMKTKNIFGLPIDILVEALQLIVEVVKLLTPNKVSKFQKPSENL